MLGVRKFDDWIHALEIGNIMHLNPLTTQELMWNNGGGGSNNSSAAGSAALNKHQEFQKDPMLKKLVLLVVALFSIATEMRMLVQIINKKKQGEANSLIHAQLQQRQEDFLRWSELWHA